MQLRQFLVGIAGAAALPLAAHAQRPSRPTIGVLVLNNQEPFCSELQAGLRGHGYVEGQNVAFDFRFADGSHDRLRVFAAELVRQRVDIIVAHFTPAATEAKKATSDIPIVMAWAGDPVGTGLISTLARPG